MRLVIISLVALLFLMPWVVNAIKFANCDFESDYKCEAIHIIGVIAPPASYITVWFDTDS